MSGPLSGPLSGEAEARAGPPAAATGGETTASTPPDAAQARHLPPDTWAAREIATLKRATKRSVAAASGIGVIVGLASAILATLFVVLPNLKPSTTNLVAISNVVVEPNVTFGQYLQHPSTVIALRARGMDIGDIRRRSQALQGDGGVAVDFQFEVRGYGGTTLQTRWTLFDADTGERLGESEQLDPLPLSFVAQKNEADIGTWEAWVRTSDQRRKSYFVRIEMYDTAAGTRLTYQDSNKFSPSP